MSRHIHLATHLSVGDLEQRYRAVREPHERSWWQILWLLALGQTAIAIADSTGYTLAWIGQIAKRYNEQGPDAMVNRRYTTSGSAPRMLATQQQEELRVWRWPVRRPTAPTGWQPNWVGPWPRSGAGATCNASGTANRCRGHSTP